MKMLKRTYTRLALTMAALLTLLLSQLLTSCSLVTDGEYDDAPVSSSSNYINLTLYVSSGETATRAPQPAGSTPPTASALRAPQGGENGDGREAGFQYENQVAGITLILYKGTGVDDAEAKVDFVRYYAVTEANLEGRDAQGTTYSYDAAETYRSEALYTTGDQKLAKDELDLTGTYHVLIVANQDVSNVCPKGTPISTVRDLTINNVYATATPAKPTTAQQFVMTSERDAVIDFGGMAPVEKEGAEHALVYRVMQPLLIERLSARIDYNTKGSSYKAAKGGYEYAVGTDGDVFVVTAVTPFNLYNEATYLFKRVQDAWPATATTYFGDERPTNYVRDPKTSQKDNTTGLAYQSPIAQNMTTSSYRQVMTDIPTAAKFQDGGGALNLIIAYPKENTLMPTSHLMKYATGLAFEGDYYYYGNPTPEHRVYYTYLRHQGELATGSYTARQWSELSAEEVGATGVAMNIGIVRNNIYRVSIESIEPLTGTLNLRLDVHDWRHVDHPEIYI